MNEGKALEKVIAALVLIRDMPSPSLESIVAEAEGLQRPAIEAAKDVARRTLEEVSEWLLS